MEQIIIAVAIFTLIILLASWLYRLNILIDISLKEFSNDLEERGIDRKTTRIKGKFYRKFYVKRKLSRYGRSKQ